MAFAAGGASAANFLSGAGGAGSMALGPWMLGTAGIQAGASLLGSVFGQNSAREAQKEAGKNLARQAGFDLLTQEKDRAAQIGSLIEGYNFMQSPVFQSNRRQDRFDAMALAGKFNPYLSGLATRM